MGRGGEALHEWMFAGKSAADIEAFQTTLFSGVGAVIMGRRMVDLGIGPWGEEPPYHAPCFVVTHRPAETIVKKGGTSYIFVTEGIEAAMAQAKAAADEQDVMVNGGADIDRQYHQRRAYRRDPPAPRARPPRRRYPFVHRCTPGPAAGPEPGDQQPTGHAPDLPGRRFCRPGVAGRPVASWLHGHGRSARG